MRRVPGRTSARALVLGCRAGAAQAAQYACTARSSVSTPTAATKACASTARPPSGSTDPASMAASHAQSLCDSAVVVVVAPHTASKIRRAARRRPGRGAANAASISCHSAVATRSSPLLPPGTRHRATSAAERLSACAPASASGPRCVRTGQVRLLSGCSTRPLCACMGAAHRHFRQRPAPGCRWARPAARPEARRPTRPAHRATTLRPRPRRRRFPRLVGVPRARLGTPGRGTGTGAAAACTAAPP